MMKKTIYSKIDKKAIPSLPKVIFEGRIIVVTTESEAEKAVDFLLSHDILGVDTETRPAFKKGQQHKVALLQVSTHDVCVLFRLNLTGMTPSIIRLLEDKKVPKIGLSLHDDIISLHRRAEFKFPALHGVQYAVLGQLLHPSGADSKHGGKLSRGNIFVRNFFSRSHLEINSFPRVQSG